MHVDHYSIFLLWFLNWIKNIRDIEIGIRIGKVIYDGRLFLCFKIGGIECAVCLIFDFYFGG